MFHFFSVCSSHSPAITVTLMVHHHSPLCSSFVCLDSFLFPTRCMSQIDGQLASVIFSCSFLCFPCMLNGSESRWYLFIFIFVFILLSYFACIIPSISLILPKLYAFIFWGWVVFHFVYTTYLESSPSRFPDLKLMRCHFMPAGMAYINRPDLTSAGRTWRRWNSSTLFRDYRLVLSSWKKCQVFTED